MSKPPPFLREDLTGDQLREIEAYFRDGGSADAVLEWRASFCWIRACEEPWTQKIRWSNRDLPGVNRGRFCDKHAEEHRRHLELNEGKEVA